MTDRPFLVFTSTLLLAVVGCRGTAKTGVASPTPTPGTHGPSNAPALSGAVPTKAPPPGPATMVPVKTFEVQPPTSFTEEQLPQGQPVQFMVQGNAGEFLRVQVNLGRGSDPTNSVSAQRPGTNQPLEALREGGDCSGNFVYQLPETGIYPVELSPTGRKASVEFTLLPSDDPMVDPGISPDQVLIDFGPLAKPKQRMTLEPFGQWKGCIGNWEPSHWVLRDDQFEFRIMQVEGYKKVLENDSSQGHAMDLLEKALRKRGQGVSAAELGYQVYDDSTLYMATQPRFIQGQGWTGLRWIAQYAQDSGCGFENLSYVFEGMTDDHRFFIVLVAEVSNPVAARILDQECSERSKGYNLDEFFAKQMPALFDKDLAAADPASFTPHLDQLDAVIKSLKLKR